MLKELLALTALLGVFCTSNAMAKEDKKMDIMLHSYQPFPAISDRTAWEKVAKDPKNREIIDNVRKIAHEAMTTPVPPCSAAKFMEFNRNGNRSNYEKEYFARRMRLQALVLAEALEYKGRYTDMIIEYLYNIANEYTWAIPAHTAQRDVLPFYGDGYEEIDLFSAETSHSVALTLSLMEKELAAVSPNLVKRLKKLVMERAILPVENKLERYWWKDLVSNWNPWICSNLLASANIMLKDEPERLTAFANKLIPITDKYYNAYSADGGCEEGPMYWTISPVSYFFFLESLYRMSDGRINRFSDEKFRRMCEFIVDVHCGRDDVVTYADSVRNLNLSAGVLRHIADRIGSGRLRTFINRYATVAQKYAVKKTYNGGQSELYDLFIPAGEAAEPKDFVAVYPKLEQIYLRKADRFFSVKGGNNGENHGHLDCGQFVFLADGKYLALDAGGVEYNKQVFSKGRFEIPVLNSQWHNPLVFNGIGQGNGKKFAVRDFRLDGDENRFTVSLELAGCYPAELGLKSYRRTLNFDGKSLNVRDEYSADKELSPVMTIFSQLDNPVKKSNAEVRCTSEVLTDSKLIENWDKKLTRVTLSGKPGKSGTVELTLGVKQ